MTVQTLKQKENLKFGILQITREFEGVKFIEGNLSKDEEMLVINTFTSSNPNKSVLYVTNTNGKCIYQHYIGTSEKALVGVLISSTKELNDNLTFYPEAATINGYLNNIFSDQIDEGHSEEFDLSHLDISHFVVSHFDLSQ